MALSIKSPEAEALARRVSEATGESLTGAIIMALRERLERVERHKDELLLADQLDEIARRATELPVLDARSAEEIVGYDEHGIPR
jgi:antitoxin VapB